MIGFIRVLDTPWFSSTGEAGKASIANVPPGRYNVVLWHPRAQGGAKNVELVIEIGDVYPAKLDAQLELGAEPAPPKSKRLLRDRLRDGRGP
jgi:hypothetical protein